MYDLVTPKVPRLSGVKLSAVTSLAEQNGLGALVRNQIMQSYGLPAFRRTHVAAAPAQTPIRPQLGHKPESDVDLSPLLEAGETNGFRFETTADFIGAYQSGKTDPLEVAERAIAAIAASEKTDLPMRIFIAHDPENVREQAGESKRRLAEGKARGALEGVPILVKDEMDMIPYPTTVGTSFLGERPATQDAAAVKKLRDAGAVLLGKANMHEIGLGVTGFNPHHGSARNPYEPEHHTGGSSSGTASGVGFGLGPFGIGADGGGSVRTPASFCGLFGLKPTWGRISEHGVAPVCWSVGHLGPLAVSARDCALGYALMAGRDEHDLASLAQPPVDLDGLFSDDLSNVTMGIYRSWFEDADPEVVHHCEELADFYIKKGAKLKEIEIPSLEPVRVAHAVSIISEMAASQAEHRDAHEKDYGHDIRIVFALARDLTSTDYVHAQRHRAAAWKRFARVFEDVDVIVTPTNACTAPPITDSLVSDIGLLSKIIRYAPAGNLLGIPAISIPAGYDKAGLPIGFQAMGRPWEEKTLLRLAMVSEQKVERTPPKSFVRLLEG